jgi:hypothetical protein
MIKAILTNEPAIGEVPSEATEEGTGSETGAATIAKMGEVTERISAVPPTPDREASPHYQA